MAALRSWRCWQTTRAVAKCGRAASPRRWWTPETRGRRMWTGCCRRRRSRTGALRRRHGRRCLCHRGRRGWRRQTRQLASTQRAPPAAKQAPVSAGRAARPQSCQHAWRQRRWEQRTCRHATCCALPWLWSLCARGTWWRRGGVGVGAALLAVKAVGISTSTDGNWGQPRDLTSQWGSSRAHCVPGEHTGSAVDAGAQSSALCVPSSATHTGSSRTVARVASKQRHAAAAT